MRGQKLAIGLERFTTFGDLLKFLRRRSGLTQRELSIAVGYSHAQISRLELNQRLPDLATITARFIPALDLSEEPEAATRLLDLAAGMRREDAPASGVSPFKGLQYFTEADADLFFGREALVARLVERIVRPASPTNPEASHETSSRILAVVGASGSGKSSILRAGLIPLLRWDKDSADWLIYTLTPTAHPLQALAAALTHESTSITATTTLVDDLAREPRSLHFYSQRLLQEDQGIHRSLPPGKRQAPARVKQQPLVFLAVDQFEELFTLCRDEAERQAFITNLMTAASEPDGCVYVVLTLRADFYAHCAPYPALRRALASQQEYIGPMSAADLRRAIEEPALHGGWELEPGLVDVLLKDLGAEGTHLAEPGALPLLSHALVETWQRRRGRTLTVSGYLASGGVHGAIAETAEVIFQDELDARQQGIARSIFLRLTELGDEEVPAETRRRATFDELIPKPEDATAVREVLTRLADARLIVTDQDVAEVAHEALIREWPTLRGWLEESRDSLRLHRHLTLAAEGWLRQGRDPGELYRGARLAQALEWAQAQPGELNAQEREFLQASQVSAEREASEREEQRQRELESARTLAETQSRSAAQLRRRALYLAAAFILALSMAVVALFFGQQARRSERQALEAGRLASTRELAASAINSLEVDPELGILLALQAISTTRAVDGSVLPEAEGALHRALLASHIRLVLSGHQYGVLTAAYSPDGRRIATIGKDGTVIVWDSATGKQLFSMPGTTVPGDAIGTQRLAYSPDGTRLVTGDRELVKLWDARTGAEIATFTGHTGEVWAVAFSPDGSRIASAGVDATVRIWDATTGKTVMTLAGHEGPIEGLAYSPDGNRLATASDDATIKIWDASSSKLLLTLGKFADGIFSVAFSPDGKNLTAATQDGIQIWEVDNGHPVLTIPVTASNIVFSPDGQRLAGSTGSVAKLWDAHTGQEQLTLAGHTDWLMYLAFSPDGKRLVTTSLDHTARVWSITPDEEALTLQHSGGLVAFSPDGRRLATDRPDGTLQLWDRQSGEQVAALHGHSASLLSLAFSPDGQRLVTGSNDNTARVWDLVNGQSMLTLAGHDLFVRDAAFSPDGKWIATAGFDQTAKLWDAATGKVMLTLSGYAGLVTGVAFNPDSTRLATSCSDGTAKIWSIPGGELLFTLSGHTESITDITFSPDGTRLATSSRDATVKIWDSTTGSEVFPLTGHRADIWSVKFSPDGRFIATASGDNTARLWEASTGKSVLTLSGSGGGVTDVSFSPRDGGAELAVASVDGLVRIYLLRLPELLALAHTRLTRHLTNSECQQYLHVPTCPTE